MFATKFIMVWILCALTYIVVCIKSCINFFPYTVYSEFPQYPYISFSCKMRYEKANVKRQSGY